MWQRENYYFLTFLPLAGEGQQIAWWSGSQKDCDSFSAWTNPVAVSSVKALNALYGKAVPGVRFLFVWLDFVQENLEQNFFFK